MKYVHLKVNNYEELVAAVKSKCKYKILKHYKNSEYVGQIRKPNIVTEKNCFSIIPNDPTNTINTYNHGRGILMPYGREKDWRFSNGCCLNSWNGRQPIMKIAFFKEAEEK